ncbi:DegV family protein [Pueribacillus sp. YX66]|uniref:DegV family protein n=1 Tax=Pueribacillus sp. YX66 TaxID=3229242 RepID=UPI00358D08EA
MAKTAVITDSTSYIDDAIRKEKNIVMIPLNVIFGEESFLEEIELTAEQFYEKMRGAEELPKTSQPAVGEFVQLYEELRESQYTDIIVVTLSSGISGTFQAAQTAATMVENVNVYVFDSEISCSAQAFFVLEAAEMAIDGKDGKAIVTRLDEIKQKGMEAFFVVDDLTNLRLGGRLSGAQAFFGGLLQIKPVLEFKDGRIVPFEKIRTRKRALARLRELFHNDVQDGEKVNATVIHGNRPDDATEIKQELEKKYDNVTVDISYFGPVIGTHLGEGAIGLTWYKP